MKRSQLLIRTCIMLCFVIGTSQAVTAQLAPISRLSRYVRQYQADKRSLNRKYILKASTIYYDRMEQLYDHWMDRMAEINYDELSVQEAVDFILLRRNIRTDIREIQKAASSFNKIQSVIPFQPIIQSIRMKRKVGTNLDGKKFAEQLVALSESILNARNALKQEGRLSAEESRWSVNATENLHETLKEVYEFYFGYDPDVTWWSAKPYERADSTLANYITFLERWKTEQESIDESGIVGNPVGKEKLQQLLEYAMIPYSPQELIEIAQKEYQWSMQQMLEASRDLGYGDDWRAALEYVKETYVSPGQQPEMVYGLAQEAIQFLEQRDVITIPKIAKEDWGMKMMSPERQLVNPFFLGGRNIIISYPTNTMTHEAKMMSMRGNNPNFSNATVHHELIAGHHLQGFMASRYHPYRRRAFGNPFFTEGWALYWEFRLWDMGFPETPEERIGMMFWRMHRSARIIFSFKFHLGEMSPQEAIDFLVEKVGHEYKNAEAEVRRSFATSYPPLYQAAYMIGGLQIYALNKQLVQNGPMSEREFHDSFLKNGYMPIEMMRYLLMDEKPPKDFTTHWRFYENLK